MSSFLFPVPIGAGRTHSLRRTFASLLYEAGASPAYVMSQMGHTSASLALEVYAKKMARATATPVSGWMRCCGRLTGLVKRRKKARTA